MNERLFVLGVGAQKAGTTWLYSYIANNSKVNMGFAKEYHIWDAVYSPLGQSFKLDKNQLSKFDTKEYFKYCMQTIPGFYEAYFDLIFSSGAKITGDITPAYSVLSENDFKKIKEKIELIGAKIRCIFLMRDPLERCWSSVRMRHRNKGEIYYGEEDLREKYSTEHFQCRTRYEIICERLRKVFNDEELYFGFYETMFSDSEIKRISEFLSLPLKIDYRHKHFNVSPKMYCVSSKLRNEIRNFYSSTYDYCFENFVDTRTLWNI